ncbi:helix-turn-helix transcriptional regulator [Motilimonas pumila]|uniref:HTH luxR-type domain-containing protein n=1 Tax=Motilimonas pumila TaxID=2303987 RepID=A0A418YB60_9GAMM|nr:LuxR C-terminal-related transcriptional regulator [Motilimonas pumila]RJG40197.1 hypothetical protein D1Z90_16795 [Motilimonas pumila]
MSQHQGFIIEQMNGLLNCEKSCLLEAVEQSISRSLQVFPFDRITLIPASKLQLISKQYFSAQRYDNQKLVFDFYVNLQSEAVNEYLAGLSIIRDWRYYNALSLRQSSNTILRALYKEGFNSHYTLPLTMFGELQGGLAISTMTEQPCRAEYLQVMQLLSRAWLMCWREAKFSASVATDYEQRQADKVNLESLTRRQLQVLRMIGSGKSNQVVAGELNLSIRSVESHKYRIGDKLNLAAGDTLTKFAMRHNIWQ